MTVPALYVLSTDPARRPIAFVAAPARAAVAQTLDEYRIDRWLLETMVRAAEAQRKAILTPDPVERVCRALLTLLDAEERA